MGSFWGALGQEEVTRTARGVGQSGALLSPNVTGAGGASPSPPEHSSLCCWICLLFQSRGAVIPAGSLCGVCLAGIKLCDPRGFSVPRGLIPPQLLSAPMRPQLFVLSFPPCPNPWPHSR